MDCPFNGIFSVCTGTQMFTVSTPLYIIHYTVNSIHYTLYIIQYTVQCTLYINTVKLAALLVAVNLCVCLLHTVISRAHVLSPLRLGVYYKPEFSTKSSRLCCSTPNCRAWPWLCILIVLVMYICLKYSVSGNKEQIVKLLIS